MTKTLWLAIVGIVVAAGIFARGYQCGHDRTAAAYEKQIAALKADWQAKRDAAEKEAQDRYEKQSKQLADALAERDKAMADAGRVRTVAVRVRDAADTRAKSDLQTARDAGDHTQERLARCESLLGEGADLVGEGVELSARVSADKDAVVQATSRNP